MHQAADIQVGANQAGPLSLTFVDKNLRQEEQNLNFDLGIQHNLGEMGPVPEI